MKPVAIVAVVALAFIAVLVFSSLRPHPAVGKWRHEFLALTVDPDNVATVYGIVCSWKEIDRDSIRIQPPVKIDVPRLGTIGLAFKLTVEEGGQRAFLEPFDSLVTLERDGPAR
jgi:preprotein translocase subunit YajC